MKKFLLSIFLILALALPCQATDWYACNSSVNINAADQWKTDPTCAAGTTLTWGEQAAGDNFYANAKTAIAINADPGPNGTITLRTDAGAGTTGGGFTYATASNLTMTMYIVAGTTTCLVISGTAGGGAIVGNVTGGTATSAYGISSSHTTVTISLTGNSMAGSGSSAHGIFLTSGGPMSVTGDVSGYTGIGAIGLTADGSTGVTTINGACSGGTGKTSNGCVGAFSSTGKIIVTGNIINSVGSGISGKVAWHPASAQNYVKFDGGGTVIYASIPPALDKILPSASRVDSTDGSYDAGTASAGGGAWAN